jgi:hypothetical protein
LDVRELLLQEKDKSETIVLFENGAFKESNLFTFTFRPDSELDLLNLSFMLDSKSTTNGGTNAHVGIQAVTISAVPEPSTSLLLLGAGVVLYGFRRLPKRA